jgi:hypothetical protein
MDSATKSRAMGLGKRFVGNIPSTLIAGGAGGVGYALSSLAQNKIDFVARHASVAPVSLIVAGHLVRLWPAADAGGLGLVGAGGMLGGMAIAATMAAKKAAEGGAATKGLDDEPDTSDLPMSLPGGPSTVYNSASEAEPAALSLGI